MIRELIEQIESEKVAEAAFGYDPYDNRMKSAFFEELELIEKEAGWLRETGKRIFGAVTRRGPQAAQRTSQPRVPKFKGNKAEYNAAVAPKTDAHGITTHTFTDTGGKIHRRRELSIPGLTS